MRAAAIQPVERLGDEPCGGDELGAGRIDRPMLGQLEAVAIVLIGLADHGIHLGAAWR